ncbi:ribonuclease H [Senna tora]|uniref:Ribonuclease H n=1 Tax=Senna tora TaxID=362788 RepID=A0A834T082_9FABA|nr:ribonuclease H [Senna tora]
MLFTADLVSEFDINQKWFSSRTRPWNWFYSRTMAAAAEPFLVLQQNQNHGSAAEPTNLLEVSPLTSRRLSHSSEPLNGGGSLTGTDSPPISPSEEFDDVVKELLNTIYVCGLVDVPAHGFWYTWSNNRKEEDMVREKLDRVYCNSNWLQEFPNTWVEILPIASSDHAPMVIHDHYPSARGRRQFRFELMWMFHPLCKTIIHEAWRGNTSERVGSRAHQFHQKIDIVTKNLSIWNRNTFGNVGRQIQEVETQLASFQNRITNLDDSQPQVQEEICRKRLEFLLKCEETMWAQRAQQLWLINGDHNTKYCHTVVNSRRTKSRICMIQNELKEWITNQQEIRQYAVQFFSDMFSSSNTLTPAESKNRLQGIGKRILEAFGEMSGLFMNPQKSEVKFTSNCPPSIKNSCADILQCQTLDRLGKYLGGFIDGPARDRQNFKVIMDHLTKRLQGWKAHMLSQAARCTLIKATLTATPIYYLQFTKLTRKEVAQCDRFLSRFFWGHTSDKPGISMISWLRLCQSKLNGGLGIRRFDPLNKALLGKQYWRVLTQPHTLLHRVFRARYGDPHNPRKFTSPATASPLWKKIHAFANIVTGHTAWRVGNGASINLSDEMWFPMDHQNHEFSLVSDLICNRRWNSSRLNRVYEPSRVRQISKIPVSYGNVPDSLIWKLAPHGKYTIKEAYSYLASGRTPTRSLGVHWLNLWKIRLPFKLLMFIWKLLHQSLPLGIHLIRRRFRIDGKCTFGCNTIEDEEHLFKDCPFARAVWFGSSISFVGRIWVDDSFCQSVTSWCNLDLKHPVTGQSILHEAIVICWEIYNQRNQVLFSQQPPDPVGVVRKSQNFLLTLQHIQALPSLDPFFNLQNMPSMRFNTMSNTGTTDVESINLLCCWLNCRQNKKRAAYIFWQQHDQITPN